MIELVDLKYLATVAVLAVGVSYVITGSTIGYWVRWLWWHAAHRIHLEALAFCPSCNAWWVGLVTAFLTGSPMWVALQCAFGSCGLAAIVQAWFGLAAEDRKIISGEESNDHGRKHQ